MTDGIALIEAGYRLEPDDGAWMQGIAEVLETLVDADQGFNVSTYDASDLKHVKLERWVSFRSPVSSVESSQLNRAAPASQVPRLYPPVPLVGWLSQMFSKSGDGRKVVDLASKFGECMGVLCPSAPRRGMVLSLFSPEVRTGKLSFAAWLRIGTHLSHAGRLREALRGGEGLELGPDDAIFEGDGTLVDAAGAARALDARQALRDAARAVDRARGSQRHRDPERALLTWKGLVEGRWSLVDHFDSDGRSFLVARRNEPAFRRPRMLSPRERHVAALAAVGHPSKVIAYQLGISTAAATATLTRALHKLGLHSRAELATVAGVLDPWGGTPSSPASMQGRER